MNVNRRGFLQIGGLIIGGIAITEAIPLNRVWSFPTEIVIPKPSLPYWDAPWIPLSELRRLEALTGQAIQMIVPPDTLIRTPPYLHSPGQLRDERVPYFTTSGYDS